jgi:hypothetical protein
MESNPAMTLDNGARLKGRGRCGKFHAAVKLMPIFIADDPIFFRKMPPCKMHVSCSKMHR